MARGPAKDKIKEIADRAEGKGSGSASPDGKDDKTGRFLPGNKFWLARSSHGANPKFAKAEDLWSACCEYFEWADSHPLHEAKAFAYEGAVTVEPLPKMRAMTIGGLCMFLDVTHDTWIQWRKNRSDLSEVISRAEAVIYQQKFEGASAGLLVPNIIARDLGLAEKSELTGKDGGPIETKATDRDLAKAIAALLSKGMKAGGSGD